MTQTNIIIRFSMEGFHTFPMAFELFPEVAFLSDRHRHTFHFECEKKVNHDDRDVEFILFKREVQSYLLSRYANCDSGRVHQYSPLEFGSMSCEMIARNLLETYDLESCIVWEDNENGSKIFKINEKILVR